MKNSNVTLRVGDAESSSKMYGPFDNIADLVKALNA